MVVKFWLSGRHTKIEKKIIIESWCLFHIFLEWHLKNLNCRLALYLLSELNCLETGLPPSQRWEVYRGHGPFSRVFWPSSNGQSWVCLFLTSFDHCQSITYHSVEQRFHVWHFSIEVHCTGLSLGWTFDLKTERPY